LRNGKQYLLFMSFTMYVNIVYKIEQNDKSLMTSSKSNVIHLFRFEQYEYSPLRKYANDYYYFLSVDKKKLYFDFSF
jgi:hypothetical protein